MASFRYRCQIPGNELEKHGHNVYFNGGEAHICVFSKPTLDDITVARVAKEGGCVVVVDIGDDHFSHPIVGPIYAEMLGLADYIVCPTDFMRERMREFVDKDIEVIGDPYEMEELAPHAQGDQLLWFGNPLNLKDIAPYQEIGNLIVYTGDPWSLKDQKGYMKSANKVLLPTQKGSGHKTANRLVNSLRMGLFPICDPHPSYGEFKDFVWTGGIETGLRWVKAFEDGLDDCVKEGQKYVNKHYSPKVIGDQWASFINSI